MSLPYTKIVLKIDDLNTENSAQSMYYYFFEEFKNEQNLLCFNLVTKKNLYSVSSQEVADFINRTVNSKTVVLFDYLYEGYSSNVFDKIYDIVSKTNLDYKKVYYLSGANNIVDCHNEYCNSLNITTKINVRGCNSWESWVQFQLKNLQKKVFLSYEAKPKEKIFLCFNRVLRLHRLALIGLLCNENLLDKGYISFFPDGNHSNYSIFNQIYNSLSNYVDSNLYQMIKDGYRTHEHLFPLKLNIEKEENANYLKENDVEYFANSYFSVVTETYFFDLVGNSHKEENSIFFSEKIFKPISMLHPFILVGKQNSLKSLQKMGYKTFHPFIDETYDSIPNHQQRLLAILHEIKRLTSFTESQWIEWQNSIMPIVNFNRVNLLNKKPHQFRVN